MKILLFILFLSCLGCQTVGGHGRDQSSSRQGRAEAVSAIESVAGAVTQRNVKIKYCPLCGRRYSPSQTVCAHDGSELLYLEAE
jgi:hypothetical protein